MKTQGMKQWLLVRTTSSETEMASNKPVVKGQLGHEITIQFEIVGEDQLL